MNFWFGWILFFWGGEVAAFPPLISGTEKEPQRTCVTKIPPNFRVNFLLRFASKSLFCCVVPSIFSENSLVLFVRFFWLGVHFWSSSDTRGCRSYTVACRATVGDCPCHLRHLANAVVRRWGRTDLTGFSPDFTFSTLSGYALWLWKHMIQGISTGFNRTLTRF